MPESIRLSEALTLPPFAQARVVAGAAGLDRHVVQVNVMEVPDILPWVKPNQLLLTTTYPLRDERAALSELIPSLAERGLAGLAIKPARYIEAIPAVMLEAADRLAFPLIELPPDTSFDEIINAVLGSILNVQAARLERSAAIHARFTRIVLTGGGLREIAQTLAELVERPAAIVGADATVLATSSGSSARRLGSLGRRGRLDRGAGERSGRWSARNAADSPSRAVAVQPIQVDAERHGAIIVALHEGSADDDGLGGTGASAGHGDDGLRGDAPWLRDAGRLGDDALLGSDALLGEIERRDDGRLGDDALIALEHAATVAALRMVQERVLAEADRRFRAVCLEELVTGHLLDAGMLHERSLAFGWDLARPRAVLLAEIEEVGGRRFAQLVGTSDEGRARSRLAEAAIATLGGESIVWERSAGAAALVASSSPSRSTLRDAATALQAEAARRLPGGVVAIGVGRTCDDPLDLPRSHREALRALVVGRRAHGAGQVSLFEDLGLDRLLASCAEGELGQFCDATLDRLVAYDAERGADLVRTLETFLACNGNAAVAARALFVHYNTLRHRITTMERILGLSLDDAEHRLNLGVALRIWRMFPR